MSPSVPDTADTTAPHGAIDSGVYRRLSESLRATVASESPSLPAVLLAGPLSADGHGRTALAAAIRETVDGNSAGTTPLILRNPQSVACESLRETLRAVCDRLSEPGLDIPPFHAAELVRFVVACTNHRRPFLADSSDSASLALLCFVLEAAMHFGWCPSAFEGFAKRAAHLYFGFLRKSLFTADPAARATAFVYVQGAWLLAQNTEGIADSRLASETGDISGRFLLRTESRLATYAVRMKLSPQLLWIVAAHDHAVPHPFRNLSHDGRLGLTFLVEGATAAPCRLVKDEEIRRTLVAGTRHTFECEAGNIGLSWTVVCLAYENTLYRIDNISLPTDSKSLAIAAELRFAVCGALQRAGADRYSAGGRENTVVELIRNPLGLRLAGVGPDGIATLACPASVAAAGRIESIVAWAQGKNVSSINRTNLLGVYD